MSDVPLPLLENNDELESFEYEIKHNSCKIIGEERFKRINQIIGFLKSNKMFCNNLRKFQNFLRCKNNDGDFINIQEIINKFNEVFGVLDLQDKDKGSDSQK